MSRTALLLRMTRDEAEKVRSEAVKCGDNMNAYVLSVATRAAVEDQLESEMNGHTSVQEDGQVTIGEPKPSSSKTALLVRCSVDEAARVREAASRRKMTIVGFIRHALRMSWEAENNKRGVTADRMPCGESEVGLRRLNCAFPARSSTTS
jgi:hypothetical protein